MAISPASSRTLIVPVSNGGMQCCSLPFVLSWPSKHPDTIWDCSINIAADLADSDAVVATATCTIVYTDTFLTITAPVVASPVLTIEISGGTATYVYAVEFTVTMVDGRVFTYYVSVPVSSVPANAT